MIMMMRSSLTMMAVCYIFGKDGREKIYEMQAIQFDLGEKKLNLIFCYSWFNQLQRLNQYLIGYLKFRNPEVSFKTGYLRYSNLQPLKLDVGWIAADARAHSANHWTN